MPTSRARTVGRVAIALAIVGALAVLVGSRAIVRGGLATGRYARLNGIRMYYELHGRGPALVLLHGGPGDGRAFDHQVPAFERRFRVIVPDMCAQGRTSDRDAPLTYHAMAEDVVALMDRLGVKRFDVMGWSDGGNTGLDLAIHHPDRLARLVTFGANFRPDGLNPTDVAWDDTATASAFGDGMRQWYVREAPDPGHYEIAMNKIILMQRTLPQFTPRELGAIRVKTLVCAGEHDLVRREHTEALASAIPGAEMWIVPGATHGAMIEKSDQVNARVLEFLTR